jgi:hypothetical protein
MATLIGTFQAAGNVSRTRTAHSASRETKLTPSQTLTGDGRQRLDREDREELRRSFFKKRRDFEVATEEA